MIARKFIFLLLLFLLFINKSSYSQMVTELWGALPESGPISNNGTIYKVDTSGNNFSIVTGFSAINYSKYGRYSLDLIPVKSTSGKIYGATIFGGAGGNGTLFEYDPQTNNFHSIFNFSSTVWRQPFGSVIIVNNKIYGITSAGGYSTNLGCIYSYDLNTGTFNVLYQFTQPNQVIGHLFLASNGKLFGTTYSGGSNNLGFIYQCDTSTGTFTVKHNFDSLGGYHPAGNLIEQNGIIYGVTHDGGTQDKGVIYQYNISNGSYLKKIDFDSINGQNPIQGLIFANSGLLAGMTYSGGINDKGVIYTLNTTNNQFTKKHDFTGIDGANPRSVLLKLGSGELYGVCPSGGSGTKGTLFRINISTGNFVKLYDFNDMSMYFPSYDPSSYSSLVYGAYGKLFGTSNNILYEYDILNDTLTIKYNNQAYDARKVYGPLLNASDGNIYGIATNGGTFNKGSIFEIEPSTMQYTILYSFKPTDGTGIKNGFIQANNGKLYGLAPSGGTMNNGTLFEFDIATHVFSVKYNFPYDKSPRGNLIQANNNKLYGVIGIGANHDGYIFEFDIINTGAFCIKSSLRYPFGGMIKATNGKLYGVDMMGGAYLGGSLYEYDPVQDSIIIKASFPETFSGLYHPTEIIQAANGKLYGVTRAGGINNSGGIFEYDIATDSLSNLYDYNYCQYGNISSLMQSTNSKLYGIIKRGGNQSKGELFEYDIQSDTFITKVNFNDNIGKFPYFAPILISYCPIKHNTLNASACGSYTVPSGDETYTTTGTYTVYDTVQNSCGKDSLLTIHLTLTSCPGWSENPENKIGFKVFPNPSKGSFTITIEANESIEAVLSVYSISGSSIYKRTIETNSRKGFNCHLTNLKKGVYLIQLQTRNKILSNKLIVL